MDYTKLHEKALEFYEKAEKLKQAFNPWKLLRPTQGIFIL
jgi:hypothetical protein